MLSVKNYKPRQSIRNRIVKNVTFSVKTIRITFFDGTLLYCHHLGIYIFKDDRICISSI